MRVAVARQAAKRWESLPARVAAMVATLTPPRVTAVSAARDTVRGPTSRVAAGRLMLVAGTAGRLVPAARKAARAASAAAGLTLRVAAVAAAPAAQPTAQLVSPPARAAARRATASPGAAQPVDRAPAKAAARAAKLREHS